MAAAAAGRWDEAERLWRELLRTQPGHPQALHSLAVHAYRRGDRAEARALLQQAHRGAPQDAAILLTVALVLGDDGDRIGELKALDAVLALQPASLPALLAKAECLEAVSPTPQEAVPWYRSALEAAGDEPSWPTPLRARLERARARVRERGEAMAAFLEQRLGASMARLTPFEAARWREAGAILSRGNKPFPSLPARLLVPRLPAIPFFDRDAFPWASALEERTDAIRAEFLALWQEAAGEFQPYIAFAEGAPVKQWRELNHSMRWSSRFLWRNGEAQAEVQARCPQATRALQVVGMADIDELCPNAMFSVLAPHTRIPPHHGETNARLVVHLPLIVPAGCSYRVGADWREWRVGEILAFDDSIEHEARNDGDALRVVLIFDVWNPLLSPAEREMVREVSAASREFRELP